MSPQALAVARRARGRNGVRCVVRGEVVAYMICLVARVVRHQGPGARLCASRVPRQPTVSHMRAADSANLVRPWVTVRQRAEGVPSLSTSTRETSDARSFSGGSPRGARNAS
jgi:hypothetical protein